MSESPQHHQTALPRGISVAPSRAALSPRDLAWAALLGALFAASPLSGSARLVPSLAVGGAVATGVAVARARRGRAGEPTERARATLARPPGEVWALLGATGLLFAPTLVWLGAEYTESIWRNGHGLFVPLFMGLLARAGLRSASTQPPQASAWGFAFLGPAAALAVADAGVRSQHLGALGLVLALPGLSLLLLGVERTRRLVLPLSLGILLLPVPANLESPIGLPAATAALMEPLVDALGLGATRHGTLYQLASGHYLVITQNCSGLSALYGGLAWAVLLAATGRSRLRGLLLVAAVYPLVAVLNALRGVALVVIAHFGNPRLLDTPLHGLSGIGVFLSLIAFLWLCADRRSFRQALS